MRILKPEHELSQGWWRWRLRGSACARRLFAERGQNVRERSCETAMARRDADGHGLFIEPIGERGRLHAWQH